MNRYLDHLIDPSFQGVNILFVLSFMDDDGRENNKQCYLLTVEVKDYNAMIDGRNFFDQPIKNDLKTHDNIIRLHRIKVTITQLDVYSIILISKNTTNQLQKI